MLYATLAAGPIGEPKTSFGVVSMVNVRRKILEYLRENKGHEVDWLWPNPIVAAKYRLRSGNLWQVPFTDEDEKARWAYDLVPIEKARKPRKKKGNTLMGGKVTYEVKEVDLSKISNGLAPKKALFLVQAVRTVARSGDAEDAKRIADALNAKEAEG